MNSLLQVFPHRVDGLWIIVIRFEVATKHFEDRCWILFPGGIRELVRPDGLIAIRLLVRHNMLGDQATATFRVLQTTPDVACCIALKYLA